MQIVVVDGQGGGIGKQLIEAIRQQIPSAQVLAVGTNSVATTSMLRSGAHRAATGENAVRVACRTADVIVGPVGIAIADSLMGEITPDMARAVGQSTAKKNSHTGQPVRQHHRGRTGYVRRQAGAPGGGKNS